VTIAGDATVRRMALRPASADDLDEIIALIRDLATYERMTDDVVLDREEMADALFGPDPAAHVVIAVDDESGAVAGFALWFPSFSTFLGRPGIWLEDLFVRPEHRKKGYGLALLRHLRALTDGRVEWNVLDWNAPAIEFYERLGARAVPGWTTYRWLPEDLS
jgi:GNAT superfamily N-acetyltransferase